METFYQKVLEMGQFTQGLRLRVPTLPTSIQAGTNIIQSSPITPGDHHT